MKNVPWPWRTTNAASFHRFETLCNRVEKEAKDCNFKCKIRDCTIVAVRNQFITGTTNEKLRYEALKNSWDLQKVQREGMHIESAMHGIVKLSSKSQIN